MDSRIPTYIAICCREWVAPVGFPGGRCGYCGTVPVFLRSLPESQWVTPSEPIREYPPLPPISHPETPA